MEKIEMEYRDKDFNINYPILLGYIKILKTPKTSKAIFFKDIKINDILKIEIKGKYWDGVSIFATITNLNQSMVINNKTFVDFMAILRKNYKIISVNDDYIE